MRKTIGTAAIIIALLAIVLSGLISLPDALTGLEKPIVNDGTSATFVNADDIDILAGSRKKVTITIENQRVIETPKGLDFGMTGWTITCPAVSGAWSENTDVMLAQINARLAAGDCIIKSK